MAINMFGLSIEKESVAANALSVEEQKQECLEPYLLV